MRAGLAGARWPGRCDYRPGRPGLLLDGSHTDGSARALAALLAEVFPDRRIALVFGALRDKRVGAMAAALFPLAAAVHLVRPPRSGGWSRVELLRASPPACARAAARRRTWPPRWPRRAARPGRAGWWSWPARCSWWARCSAR